MLHAGNRSVLVLMILLGSAAAILSGCGADKVTTPPAPSDPVPLVQGTLGPAGGELTHDEISLSVPAGALSAMTDLAIYAEPEGHPFGAHRGPVHRITGLPADLGAALTLRIRHGTARGAMAKGAHDTLAFFRGELREGYEFGRRLSWFAAAGRDSSGWCIAELDRGALDLGSRASQDVHTAIETDVAVLVHENNRYRIVFQPSRVDHAAAAAVLGVFEYMHDATEAMGFSFGSFADIWPLEIIVRAIDLSNACYVTGPRGAGHFILHPDWVAAGLELAPVVAHEVLHCAQTFYDPRPPEQWGALNLERLWLDEATAAYIEAATAGAADYVPFGLVFEYLLAPLEGLEGDPDLGRAEHGYGMASFIRYLCEDPASGQGEERLVQLYEHFAVHGSVAAAIAAVVDPPVADWCADMHRKLVEGRIFNPDDSAVSWHWWPIAGFLNSQAGSTAGARRTVPALGGTVAKFMLAEPSPDPSTMLSVEARAFDRAPGTAAARSGASLPLTVFGRSKDALPQLVAAGEDSLRIADFAQYHEAYDELLVLVSRPYGTAAEVDITVRVAADTLHDVFSFTRLDAGLANVRRFMVCTGTQCYQGPSWSTSEALWLRDIDGVWNGTTFEAAWNRSFPPGAPHGGQRVEVGALALTVAPDGSAILSIAASQTITYGNNDVEFFSIGWNDPAIPLPIFDDVSGYPLGYRLQSYEVCNGLLLNYRYEHDFLDALVTMSGFDCPSAYATLGVFFNTVE